MELSYLSDKELKILVIKTFTKLKREMEVKGLYTEKTWMSEIEDDTNK